MSDHEPARDPEIARALEGIPVPPYEPGFWERLEARLEREGAPDGTTDVPAVVIAPAAPVLPEPVESVEPVELTRVVPLPPRAGERRRSLTALAAAAAVVLAVLAVRLGTDEPDAPDELRVAQEGEGGTRRGPDDGTTSPSGATEDDGARTDVVDGPSTPDEGVTDEVTDRTTRSGGSRFDVSTTVPTAGAGTLGMGGGPEPAIAPAGAPTAEGAFVAWASAIDEGDVETAVALTGPRTLRHYDALGRSAEEMVESSGEAWGVWADAKGRHIQLVELGVVDGDRAMGLVLDRPSTDPEDEDGRHYDSVPVVRGDHGWQVEPAAFDPATGGRITVISPAPDPGGTELAPLAKGGHIRIAVPDDVGEYYLNLDFSQQTRIRAADAVDGEIAWNPGGQRSASRHLLIAAHIEDGHVTMVAQTFETAAA